MRYVLAGDVGGTKTNLGIYAIEDGGAPVLLREASFPSKNYQSFEQVILQFNQGSPEEISAIAAGIAGPIIDQKVVGTNLPWEVDARQLAKELGCERVRLLNDLEATAYGALFLPEQEILVLNPGVPRDGNRAVIAAGTGLGQAFLFWDGHQYHPAATEGGHADFAPRTETDVALYRFLQTRYEHVSYERLLSGPGLHNIFSFLHESLKRPVAPETLKAMETRDPGSVIGEGSLSGSCPTCAEAVDLFIDCYGAQAGNLALTVMALGGVYVGGGIVTKLLPKFTREAFMKAFVAKGRYHKYMVNIPVRIILNPKTAQLGAAHAAADLLRDLRR